MIRKRIIKFNRLKKFFRRNQRNMRRKFKDLRKNWHQKKKRKGRGCWCLIWQSKQKTRNSELKNAEFWGMSLIIWVVNPLDFELPLTLSNNDYVRTMKTFISTLGYFCQNLCFTIDASVIIPYAVCAYIQVARSGVGSSQGRKMSAIRPLIWFIC